METMPQDNPRSTAELIQLALTERDSGRRWEYIVPLHWRHDAASCEQAAALCRGESARERVLGADIIAQFGIGRDVFHDERVDLLLGLLEDRRVTVLAAAATAFGHLKDPRSIAPLVALRDHRSTRVRWGATFGLLEHEDERAVAALIEMSKDSDPHIRDWATFGIGSQVDLDTPAIRAALMDRLQDADPDAAAEAMAGLAHRKDKRVVEPLGEALKAGWNGRIILEAASEIGDSRLYPHLLEMKCRGGSGKLLDEAIASCRPPA